MTERKPHVRVSQDDYLPAIAEVGGVIALTDIAEFFNVSEGTARRQLDGLVIQGKLNVERTAWGRTYRLVTST